MTSYMDKYSGKVSRLQNVQVFIFDSRSFLTLDCTAFLVDISEEIYIGVFPMWLKRVLKFLLLIFLTQEIGKVLLWSKTLQSWAIFIEISITWQLIELKRLMCYSASHHYNRHLQKSITKGKSLCDSTVWELCIHGWVATSIQTSGEVIIIVQAFEGPKTFTLSTIKPKRVRDKQISQCMSRMVALSII